jgi:hypothetical protein
MTGAGNREQAIADHVRGLSEESAALVREQARLIREDAVAEIRRLGAGGAMLAGSGVLAVGAFGALTAGLVGGLGSRIGSGRAGFLVAILYGAAAGGLAATGLKEVRQAAGDAAEVVGRDVQAAADGARQAG